MKLGIMEVVSEIFPLCKGADADGVAIGCDDWDRLSNMFRSDTVHDDA